MKGLLPQAIDTLRLLSMKSDVAGQMRVSISFDAPHDRARFLAEINREMEGSGVAFAHHRWMEFEAAKVYGIEVRIL